MFTLLRSQLHRIYSVPVNQTEEDFAINTKAMGFDSQEMHELEKRIGWTQCNIECVNVSILTFFR